MSGEKVATKSKMHQFIWCIITKVNMIISLIIIDFNVNIRLLSTLFSRVSTFFTLNSVRFFQTKINPLLKKCQCSTFSVCGSFYASHTLTLSLTIFYLWTFVCVLSFIRSYMCRLFKWNFKFWTKFNEQNGGRKWVAMVKCDLWFGGGGG